MKLIKTTSLIVALYGLAIAPPALAAIQLEGDALRLSSQSKAQTITLKISGMRTKSCPALVRAVLEKLPGVKSYTTHLQTYEVSVTFNPQKISAEGIISAIETQTSFKAKLVR